jgi:uncharacterized protein YegP (UPF0339 family)
MFTVTHLNKYIKNMKFEIYQSEINKEFYFRLKAGNGLVVLGSEGYKSKCS